MPRFNIVRSVDVKITPRIIQLSSMFDMELVEKSREQWEIDFNLPEKWNIGLIVGPSGSVKTTIAREIFGDAIVEGFEWSDDSIIDNFPAHMTISEITYLLSSVGFSSPPAWVRPFRVLSNGEKFRVTIARAIAENEGTIVIDEFTSVVDRTVAQIGSAAVAKAIRRLNKRFVAVSCHYDIIQWLQPDLVYEPHKNQLTLEFFRRPPINLSVRRVSKEAWQLFRKHHYLNGNISTSAICFVAFSGDTPVAFTAVLPFKIFGNRATRREHRTVCLPDYQGVGIGNAMSDYIASLFTGLYYDYYSQTTHPAMIYSRARSKNWKVCVPPSIRKKTCAFDYKPTRRPMATFKYIGPRADYDEARKIVYGY